MRLTLILLNGVKRSLHEEEALIKGKIGALPLLLIVVVFHTICLLLAVSDLKTFAKIIDLNSNFKISRLHR